MTDYGHDLLFGAVLTPATGRPELALGLARVADRAGLDLVSVPDHPYRPEFTEAWTTLSVIAARTERVRVFPNVANLPLRPPAMLARAVASLGALSGGRVDLALGAGAYWDAIAAEGGPWRAPAEAVAALGEAIAVIRALWTPGGPVHLPGKHYGLDGAEPAPPPGRPGIWVGALGPRMLRLTGTLADGWLPSMTRIPPADLPAANAAVDAAAADAGRDPAAIRRLYNLSPPALGSPRGWPERLADLALTHGVSGFLLPADSPGLLQLFATEIAPAVRELVAAARDGRGPSPAPLAARPTPDDGFRLSAERVWDEDDRPSAPPPDPRRRHDDREQAAGQRLIEVHDHLRAELGQLRDLLTEVAAGTLDPGAARSRLHTLTLRQNNWTLGAYCESYCRVVSIHHQREDSDVFPALRRFEPGLAPVLDRLADEHHAIQALVERVDAALVAFVGTDGDITALHAALDLLTDALLSHLSYEERELTEPLARLWGRDPGGGDGLV
ncbi:LLM class flavin-dependent oxidoreductase [Amycolatopsis thermoflava]|uniref:Alkanesulfonate monooxygenase SsuD/methylene tetrahydromethanopterin reductase-like flavin-dependent oxidoreductase (Luciferase family) n=1 Tax=Amycolatopsis thermoflava TaxID=84480 RepID=A0A3N2H3N3_9PSEU|nr:LLM class flavin-dependent oxidoreductase [Amycolatopsis thermoflava]ROS43511.1 alkanesulfonate monooxygenase SsuD/methylene tetrahydromethanopterin reductase-like flavin-dependent oxidoreductase (luciferase family) [Amycolatopsis thermoflava]